MASTLAGNVSGREEKERLQITAALLPEVDDISGLVEEDDHSLLRNPGLFLDLGLELLPRILPRPEVVGAERHGAMARDYLVQRQPDVLLHPYESKHQPRLLRRFHHRP